MNLLEEGKNFPLEWNWTKAYDGLSWVKSTFEKFGSIRNETKKRQEL